MMDLTIAARIRRKSPTIAMTNILNMTEDLSLLSFISISFLYGIKRFDRRVTPQCEKILKKK
jgi:hypothetical protein